MMRPLEKEIIVIQQTRAHLNDSSWIGKGPEETRSLVTTFDIALDGFQALFKGLRKSIGRNPLFSKVDVSFAGVICVASEKGVNLPWTMQEMSDGVQTWFLVVQQTIGVNSIVGPLEMFCMFA
ncbi:hypothetical protein FGSG_12001 [Fusarium graminearum PH-1]|uniref:Chromosome 1, complete genome n=1 Tax=Gibberella zeae (strain ATCC MYA-4620 / CBS 123657 / FGSC 9075 / NRRL 31084 / PH-1) TaxID=229533 RepID=I1S583_GIBZE|nr:hypothetical protein FGSG_12001 [Fusarium graminearum PH-1]ESU07080.1 hypothetical protein FGSG_12001 [Fusarium graminearum PH-1]CEF73914.1 unnamed protein product [Fusarium graminearum]|eukprot:XP_011317565.1 hypothetical protein FGSG_12001 [Fusarium graminearum PH-1]